MLLCFQYHGGTNFGRTAGGPFIATSYDYDAPLDEFGTTARFFFFFFSDAIYELREGPLYIYSIFFFYFIFSSKI